MPYTIDAVITDVLINVFTAAICTIAIFLSCKMKPVPSGKKKHYWLWGLIHIVAFHILVSLLPIRNGGMYLIMTAVSAAVLGVVEFFILRKCSDSNSRLAKALLVQGALMLVLYGVSQNTAAFILALLV